MEAMLPKESIPLVDSNHYNNGFMYKHGNTYMVYLPENASFTADMYSTYILPLINDLVGLKKDYVVLKCFGILEKDIKSIIAEHFSNNNINIQIRSDGLDNAIYIRYDTSIDNSVVQEIVSDICSKLSKFIYATEDTSLYDMALDLMHLRDKKIILAETITFGNITKRLSTRNEKRIPILEAARQRIT